TFSFGASAETREVPTGGGGPGAGSPGGGGGGNRGGQPSRPFSSARGHQTGGGASSSQPYSPTISMPIRNMTNHNNPGPIIGNIAAPLFGQANQPAGLGGGIFSESANNRRLELQTRLTF